LRCAPQGQHTKTTKNRADKAGPAQQTKRTEEEEEEEEEDEREGAKRDGGGGGGTRGGKLADSVNRYEPLRVNIIS
jgi:hypothetical protein